MNVIIANKQKEILDALQVDVIKRLDGEFSVDEIVDQFKNFFFQRMIIDITSIKNYRDIKNLQKLSISLDMDKIILLLDDSTDDLKDYLSKLVSMGIYNFTKNGEGLLYLYNNPNSYRDVAHIQQLDYVQGDTSSEQSTVVVENYQEPSVGTRIIGVKNITKQAGSTTFTYMMKTQLAQHYSVVAIEVDRQDFRYFNDKSLVSINNVEIGNTIAKNSDKDVILIDLNYSKQAEELCHEVISLIEPSTIKLNKLMLTNANIFKELKQGGTKVVLNQSLLAPKDVLDFEYESSSKMFYNMPPLDEREKSIFALNAFLTKLGFKRQNAEQVKKKSLLSLFSK